MESVASTDACGHGAQRAGAEVLVGTVNGTGALRVRVERDPIAGAFVAVLAARDLTGTLPLPFGVAGHEGSTVVAGLDGPRPLREAVRTNSRKDAT